MSRRQSSIFSLGLLGLTFKLDESYCEDVTEEELRQTLENIAQSNLFLRLENDVFERYLIRQNPESLQAITQILETAKRMQRIMPQQVPSSPVTSGSAITVQDKDTMSIASIQSGSRYPTLSALASKIGRGGTKIPYAHRIKIVNTVIQQLSKEVTEVERKSAIRKLYLQAQVRENENSIRETLETRERFERDVVEKGVDSITGKIPAEKFIRFIEECLKETDTMMERTRLKTMTTKIQKRKAKQQLKHRQELGEALRAIDFEQLNIENRDCIRKIEEKTQHILEMKKIAGHQGIGLTRYKEKLNNLMSTVNEVRTKIAFRKEEIMKLQSEQAAVNVEIEKMQVQLKLLTELMNNFSVPDVLDCIKIHIELQELQKLHKRLHRQREIQQITFKSSRRRK